MTQLRRCLAWCVLLAAGAIPASSSAQAPVILRQPQSTIVAAGSSVAFEVVVDPASPGVNYLWRYNGGNLPGETASTLTLSNVQFSVAGVYTVVVFNNFGAVTSDRADLLLNTISSFPFSDQFSGAVPLINPLAGRVRGANVGATTEPGEPPHAGKPARRSVWAKWTAPAWSGIVTFRTAGSGIDTVLGIYTGGAVNQLIETISDDDSDGSLNSQVRFQPQPGAEYYIAVDGFSGAAGQFVLGWSMEQTAALLPEFTVQPFDQAALPGSDVTLSVDGSDDISWQWFFEGQPIPGAAAKSFAIRKATVADVGTYFCRATLGGLSRDSRHVRLQLNFDDSGRANIGAVSAEKLFDARLVANDFHSVIRSGDPKTVARGFSGTQIFSTVGSTKEIGEPNHCGIAGGASEWYAIQAEADGTLYVNTDGSNFDTVLAVYTGPGDAFETLTSVACDNNSGLDGKDSRVSFQAAANTIYWIAVDGMNNPSNGNPARGNVVLNFRLLLPLRLMATAYTNITGGTLAFQVSGTPNVSATIQSADDFGSTNWISLFTNSSPSGTFQYTNAGVNSFPKQLFRAVNRL